jgi:ABC-2 type transport system permease protein
MFIKSFREEFNSLLKDKMKWVVLFILPVLVILLIGIEMSPEVITEIPMAVIDHDGSAFSRQLIESFDSNETFSVIDYPNSEVEMEELMRNSQIRVGMIIPKNFFNDIQSLESPTVAMLYDGSHMSMTSVSKSKAMEILLTYKAGATIKQLQSRLNMSYEEAYNITQAFQFTNRMMYNPSKSFEDFLAPILLAGLIQSAIVLVATVSINHDIYFENRRKRFGYASGKILFYTLVGSISFIICILIQIYIFRMPFNGRIVDTIILSAALSFAVSSFSILISTVFKNRMIALIGGAVVFIPNSIMAGTTWPLISMPYGYQGFAKYMPFAHYVVNLRNIYLKGTPLSQLSHDIFYMMAFGLVVLMISEFVLLIAQKESENNGEGEDEIFDDIQKRISVNF